MGSEPALCLFSDAYRLAPGAMSRLPSHIWSHSASKCGTSLLLKRRDRNCSDRAIMLLIIVNCVTPAPLETRSFTELSVTGLLIQFSRHAEIKSRAGDHGSLTYQLFWKRLGRQLGAQPSSDASKLKTEHPRSNRRIECLNSRKIQGPQHLEIFV